MPAGVQSDTIHSKPESAGCENTTNIACCQLRLAHPRLKARISAKDLETNVYLTSPECDLGPHPSMLMLASSNAGRGGGSVPRRAINITFVSRQLLCRHKSNCWIQLCA